MITKNEIISKIIDRLMKQREDLNYELANLNHNETSYNDRRMTLENAIMNIDNQINQRILDCEYINQS